MMKIEVTKPERIVLIKALKLQHCMKEIGPRFLDDEKLLKENNRDLGYNTALQAKLDADEIELELVLRADTKKQ